MSRAGTSMKRVFLQITQLPQMRHIIRPARGLHIINTAAEQSNVFYILGAVGTHNVQPIRDAIQDRRNNVTYLKNYM